MSMQGKSPEFTGVAEMQIVYAYVRAELLPSVAVMDESTPPPPGDSPPPPPPPPPSINTGSPTDFLKGVVGKRVIVRLTSGVDYRGMFCFLSDFPRILMPRVFTKACCHAWMVI